MIPTSQHRGAAGLGLGLVVGVSASVDYGPSYAISTDSESAIEFRVYDKAGQAFLGSITRRELGSKWVDELNGSGNGRLRISLSDPAIANNPNLLADDNIIKARYLGEDRFAWKITGGEDTLVSRDEQAGEISDLDGPGVLSLLQEGILRPEYPIVSDPIRDAPDRFFGYMSKFDSVTNYLLDDSIIEILGTERLYNLVTSPRFVLDTDVSDDGNPAILSTSIESLMGANQYAAYSVELDSTPSIESVDFELASSDAIAVTPGEKISMGVWVATDASTEAQVVAIFDTGEVRPTSWTAISGEVRPTSYGVGPYYVQARCEFENLTVPVGATSLVLGFTIKTKTSTSLMAYVSQPMVMRAIELDSYFDGDTLTSPSSQYAYDWAGASNDSVSVRTKLMPLTPDLQPSWQDPRAWNSNFVSILKSAASAGTGRDSPEDWPDPTAYLIWPSSPQEPTNPGTVYWRREFYNPETASVFVQAAADNQMRVWLDGVEIISAGFNGDATDITESWSGLLTEGTHLLAAQTSNFKSPNPGDNYGWFLCTVMRKENNEPIGVVTHTDPSWLCFYEGSASVPFTDTVSLVNKQTTVEKTVPVYYTVRSGDTLSKIGSRFGVRWQDIYAANKKQIDDRAARSGLPNKGPGWWIFPGQVFVIPGKYTTTSASASVPVEVVTRTWSSGTPLSTKQPGWYPYQILAKVFSEAKARRVTAFTGVTLGFAYGVDSDGNPWAPGYDSSVERSFRVGSSVYEVIQQLIESGIDVCMTPDLQLNAYRFKGRYLGITAPKADQFVLLDKGGTTISYSIDRQTEVYNKLLFDTDLGWRDYSAPISEEFGISEGSASLGGVDPDKIAQILGPELEELSRKTKTVTTRFLVVPGRRPYVDFNTGDVVVAHDRYGVAFDARIVAMAIEEDEEHSVFCEIQASGSGLV